MLLLLVLLAVGALALFGCSSSGTGEADDPAAARAARALENPRFGRLLNEPGPVTLVHAVGTLRSVPASADLAERIAPLADDTASVVALDCVLGTPDCQIEELNTLPRSSLDVVSFATAGIAGTAPSAVRQAIAILDALDVRVVGYGETSADAVAAQVLESEGRTVAFHGFSARDDLPTVAGDTTPGIAGPQSLPLLVDAIAESTRGGHDVIVVVDWGSAEARAPDESQVLVAQQLVAAGADAVVGTGSSFLQRLELIESVPVGYSLGDSVAVSDAQVELDTAVLRIEFGIRGPRACILPATASAAGPTLDRPDGSDCV